MIPQIDDSAISNLSEEEMEHFLSQENVGRIGAYYRNRVYVVPVNYVYQDGYAYGYTTDGIKIHMMKNNPKVCLEVDRVQDLDHWKSVIAWGEYQELHGEDAQSALTLLISRLAPSGNVEELTGHLRSEKFRSVVYRIKIQRKTGRIKTRRAVSPAA